MNLHKRMESVVSNAPLFEAGDPGYVDDSFDIANEGDDFGIHLNPERLPDKPNEISFDVDNDRLSLKDIFGAFTNVTGLPVDKEYVELAERHEDEHWQAARLLGAATCRFGVEVFKVDPAAGKSFAIQPFSRHIDFRTTKLGEALVAGYPSFLSEGDHEKILGYGYSGGVEQLAKIAIKRNRNRRSLHEQFYPVPLTAKTRRSRKFFWPLKR